MRTYKEILMDVANSCNAIFYNGYRNNYSDVIKSATNIYIAELSKEVKNESDYSEQGH